MTYRKVTVVGHVSDLIAFDGGLE
jgi:hypothetical protein